MNDRFSYETTDADGKIIDQGKFYVGLTEYGVQNWPDGMEGCRMFRVEYGGFNEGQAAEGTIWLPPTADADAVEDYLQGLFRDWNEVDYRRDHPDSVFLPPAQKDQRE